MKLKHDSEKPSYFTGILEYSDGRSMSYWDVIYWVEDGILHRTDGLAIVTADGDEKHYINGKLIFSKGKRKGKHV
jgi:hypothetical protein